MISFIKIQLSLCFIITAIAATTQTVTTLQFSILLGKNNFLISQNENILYDSHEFKIEVLKFYISNIQFFKGGKLVLKEENSYHLLDAGKPNSLKISIVNNNISFDELHFDLGLDSLTNVSGVMGGDLDPTKGMYWTWQSGYINFKLEGKSPLCNNRHNDFQYHLGGYMPPFDCLQHISMTVKNSKIIDLILDLEHIINNLDLRSKTHIMSPGKEAASLSQIIANSFTISQI